MKIIFEKWDAVFLFPTIMLRATEIRIVWINRSAALKITH